MKTGTCVRVDEQEKCLKVVRVCITHFKADNVYPLQTSVQRKSFAINDPIKRKYEVMHSFGFLIQSDIVFPLLQGLLE